MVIVLHVHSVAELWFVNKMKQLIFETNAKQCIINELKKYQNVETGGVLLGVFENNNIYIVEAVGGGDKAIRDQGMFQYDAEYVELQSNILARKCSKQLVLVGLWHKHNHTLEPAFSDADIRMHQLLLEQCEYGVSCLFQRKTNTEYQIQYMDCEGLIHRSTSVWKCE